MNRAFAIGGLALAVLGAGALGYVIKSERFMQSRAKIFANIDTFTEFLKRVRAEREQRAALDARLRAVAERTLGATTESVDSALRGRLNRIGEELQLADHDLAVATDAEKDRVPTPARAEFTSKERALRDQPDFVEVHGMISAEGTLDQAMRLIHRIHVEPWIKRIDQVRLDPTRNGERVRVLVRVTTLFIEGVGGPPVPPPNAEAMAGYARYAPFAQRNHFRVPPPPPPPAPPATAVVQATKPPPPAFAWNQWRVTGRLDGPLGVEACLRNTSTNATLTLAPGARIADAEFVRFERDGAVFKLAEALFRVDLGATMDQRVTMTP